MSDKITCPKCNHTFEVTEAIASQLRADLLKQIEAEAEQKERELAQLSADLRKRSAELDAQRVSLEEEVKSQVAKQREQLEKAAREKATEAMDVELKDRDQQLLETKARLAEAQKSELELRKQKRELDEQKQELDLLMQRKIDEERAAIREQAKKEADEDRRLKAAEHAKVIADMNTKLDEMRRKSEQASQQLQGEVMEIELEELLRTQFPYDTIIPVPKGVHGGDVLQVVHDATGTECGIILWESKRTKAWSDGWLPKLRDDQRSAKAHIAILVSIELPKDVATFKCIENVWVTNRACSLALASAMRHSLIQVATTRRASEGKQDKMEMLYNYLSGAEFRHRVEGIVEAFKTLREELEAEKRATQKMWAKREKQLERASMNTAGMYGDLAGIIGAGLPAIPSLESPALITSEEDTTK